MKRILLSYAATLDAVQSGKLSKADLAEAIFCFGCGKAWPQSEPTTVLERHVGRQKTDVQQDAVRLVAEAVRIAEAEGRAVWRLQPDSGPLGFYGALSEVLTKHGLEPLNPNLPPGYRDNEFLQIAIERTNNKDGQKRVQFVL
jgi:hypothetical protein